MWLHLVRPLLGTWPASQARALTGNRTSNPLLYGTMLQPPDPHWPGHTACPFLKKYFYFFIFRERGREGERERNINVWLPLIYFLIGNLTWPGNSGMCPDWELNQTPFGLQAGTQSTEPYQPGQLVLFKVRIHTYLVLFCFLDNQMCEGA